MIGSSANVTTWREQWNGNRLRQHRAVQRLKGATLSELLEAKPCPFCGEKSITIHEGSTFRWLVAECNGCGATCGEVRVQTMGSGLPAHWKTKAEQDVVEEWNKRASNVKLTG